jgi:hypothetical protein
LLQSLIKSLMFASIEVVSILIHICILFIIKLVGLIALFRLILLSHEILAQYLAQIYQLRRILTLSKHIFYLNLCLYVWDKTSTLVVHENV